MDNQLSQGPGRTSAGWLALVAVAALGVGLVAGPVLAAVVAPAPRYATTAANGDQPPEHTIAVMGSGKVTVVPDMATVNLGVVVERNTAKAARQAAAESMTKVVAALKALGIADKDIATTTVNLSPVYDYPTNATPKIRGYQLQNMVQVTVRDLDKLGDVLDNSIVAGATSVDGISFDVADRTGAEKQAREAAVADAKAKADTLASGAGVHITGVSSMSESVSTPVWYERAAGAPAMAADQAATPVMAGTTDVTITVSVTYLID
jgi:uncharacterized protein